MTLVPRNRLLAVVAFVLVPLAGAGALVPGIRALAGAAGALLLAVAVADALLAAGRAVELRAEFPATVRLSKDRPGVLAFGLRNDRAGTPARGLRLALAFPAEIETEDDELPVELPAGQERARVEWPVVPRRRGNFSFDRLHWEEGSPLGLWARRGSLPMVCEARVYPDLLRDRRQVAAIFLNRGGLGGHAQRVVGRGREFEKLRDYVPGDAIQDISWKATARRRRPISKVFQVERTQEVYVVLDASRLSARPAPRPDDPPGAQVSALERYVTSALLLGLTAERQGDLFGLVTFTDRVGTFLRARNGPAHFDACRDALYALQPALVSPDFEELATFLRLRLRRRALLVVLTALDDPLLGELFTRHIGLLSRQHLVLVNTLRPPGVEPLFEEKTDAVVANADDVYRRLAGHLQWQGLRERENLLRRHGVRFALLDNERMTAQLVSQYTNVKRRQIL